MTEMDITFIFIRYISVTIKRKARAFYRKYDRIFFNENKEFIENIDLDNEIVLFCSNSSSVFYKDIEEKLTYQELLFEGLDSLNEMEKQIICEKYFKQRSDSDIGKGYSVSSQMISKRKRKILYKLKSFF
ncbi:sigma factor-like helix-turn-helix DNA-binding protein [Enterococcus sp. DIV0098]|uniref:sigma factor-like helix-turn-helix DNA-binding protein n=1 Tax=Enterococcus sp. DIV0098 TaxID=2774843 RepID=UPI003F285F15